MKEISQRITTLKDMLGQNPEDEFVIYAMAQEYMKEEDYPMAIQHFEKLRLINPKYIGLYYHLAACHVYLEQPQTALQVYRDGIEIASNQKDLHALSELKNALMNLELEL